MHISKIMLEQTYKFALTRKYIYLCIRGYEKRYSMGFTTKAFGASCAIPEKEYLSF